MADEFGIVADARVVHDLGDHQEASQADEPVVEFEKVHEDEVCNKAEV